jgi:hypothetical protein
MFSHFGKIADNLTELSAGEEHILLGEEIARRQEILRGCGREGRKKERRTREKRETDDEGGKHREHTKASRQIEETGLQSSLHRDEG